ncbi:MAG: 16S rRNA (cytidine(1402)-2'-O)-methyltransferase [Patescibacteria group bacterium]|nr:16S rRNA (cytidine(1402)-2'-O)-methyltransferase [Patescibacteria group bacterium]
MSLYIVATPIGNLEDISFRAIRILNEVDSILCEDTRVSRKLLDYYKIKKTLISFHHHSKEGKYNQVLSLLDSGQSLALISDAGTPNISDPGGELVKFIRTKRPDINIEPIPGPSAIISALSVSGIKADKFTFFGFLPHKKGRLSMIKEILDHKYPVVFYESKHRFLRLISELQALNFSKKIIVFRELTKLHYTFYEDSLEELYKIFEQDKNALKGEFTIIIY